MKTCGKDRCQGSRSAMPACRHVAPPSALTAAPMWPRMAALLLVSKNMKISAGLVGEGSRKGSATKLEASSVTEAQVRAGLPVRGARARENDAWAGVRLSGEGPLKIPIAQEPCAAGGNTAGRRQRL
jgi:hypothetical protein